MNEQFQRLERNKWSRFLRAIITYDAQRGTTQYRSEAA